MEKLLNQFIIKMKATISLICLILLLGSSQAAMRPSHFSGTNNNNQKHIRGDSVLDVCQVPFQEYKLRYGKYYPTPEHEAYRRAVYEQNCARVQRQNMNPSRRFKSAISKFSDLTPREYKRLYLTAKFTPASSASNGEHQRNPHGGKRLLQESMSINWVDEGYVTPVRDQGWCGSCWAFSASAVIESNLLLYSDQNYQATTLHVSEQQQVDCVTQSYGCEGGWSETSFEYAKQIGITRGSTYPYTGRDGNCARNGGEYKISDFVHQNMTCQQLKEELLYGPINVAVNANDWDRIGDSIFPYQSASFHELNHAVTLVGFQEAEGGNPAYWIIKNSWGINWGDQGYAKLEYGPDGNSFGICLDVPFPII